MRPWATSASSATPIDTSIPGRPSGWNSRERPLAVGSDPNVRPVDLRGPAGRTLALSPTDACRDRLAAFYHWDDRQSLAVAAEIASRQRVKLGTIRTWSEREGHPDRFEEFLWEVSKKKSRRPLQQRRAHR